MKKAAVILLALALLLPGCAEPEAAEGYPAEITAITQTWAREGVADCALQRDLARWYNLNLRSRVPEPGYEDAYDRILYYDGGMMGYVELPSLGRCIPIYHEGAQLGLVHDSRSPFPVGAGGDHTVLSAAFSLELKDGDRVVLWMLGQPMTYEVGLMGTDSCILICGEKRFVCGRVADA